MNAPRYLAICHLKADASAPATPRREGMALALAHTSLQIWAAGPTVPLGDHGLVVGHLFTRSAPYRRVTRFTRREADRIAASRGEVLLRDYWGGYAAFLIEPSGSIRVLRDPSGALPVYWRHCGPSVALAPELDTAHFRPADGLRVDPHALALHLWSPHALGRRTCLTGIEELLPGTAFDIQRGLLSQTSLWSPWDHIAPGAGDDQTQDRLRDAIFGAVGAWGRCFEPILLGLSGGLDSTVVAAGLAAARRPVVGLTMVSDGPMGDERTFARIVASHFNFERTSAHYLPADIDITRPVVAHAPRPFLGHYVQAIVRARETIGRNTPVGAYFSGNGGDNVFCALRSVIPVVDQIRARSSISAVFATARDVARLTQSDMPTIARHVLGRLLRPSVPRQRGDPTFLDKVTVDVARAETNPHPWLLAPENVLPGKFAHVLALQRAQGNDGFHSRATHPPSISPLLAQPIVEASLSVPSWAWVEHGRDRSQVRQAFRGIIPDVLLDRTSKGGPAGFLDRLYRVHDRDISRMLRGGVLHEMGILDLPDVDVLTRLTGTAPRLAQRLLALAAAESWARHWSL